MSYYPEPDSHMSNKVKVILDLTDHDAKRSYRRSYI